jgi:hypothetical protein
LVTATSKVGVRIASSQVAGQGLAQWQFIDEGQAMNSNPIAASLSVMRRTLAEASCQLGIEEGSLQHEELASRILVLFENALDANEVLAAAIEQGRFAAEQTDHEAVCSSQGLN